MLTLLKRALASLLLVTIVCGSAAARVDEVTYMKNGAYVGKINTYRLGEALYLDATTSAKLMGGKIYWYPVSGKLMLQNKGNKMVFFMKSDEVMLNDTKVSLPNPLIVRGGRAFLAMEFFTSKHFARAFGFKQDYNPSTGVMSAQQKITISSINYFSYKDKTRLVIYLEEPLNYQTSQKENNVFTITVPNGVVEAEEKMNIGDGVITSVDVFQENKMARVVFTPGDNFGKVNSFKLSGPDRIVFDVEKSVKPIAQSINGLPAAAPVPEAGVTVIPPVVPGAAGPDPDNPEVSSAAVTEGSVPDSGVKIPDRFTVDKGGRKRIVVDAGHGGKDPGGRKAFGLKEKEINLLVAQALAQLIKDDDRFDVKLVRDTDIFVPLDERSKIANDYKADMFISVHANASRDRREKGFEVYFMSENASDPWAAEVADYENSVIGLEEGQEGADASAMLLHSLARNEYLNEGSQLAGLISKEMAKSTPFVDRGVKQAAFYVLRGTYAPGVLVELGFMTNAKDQKDLTDKKGRAKLASAIYKGILKYAQMKNWK